VQGYIRHFSTTFRRALSNINISTNHSPRIHHHNSYHSNKGIQSRWTGTFSSAYKCSLGCRIEAGRTESSLTATSLTAAEQREFQARMERKQMKEFMGVSLPISIQKLEASSRHRHHHHVLSKHSNYHYPQTLISSHSSSKTNTFQQMFSGLVDRCFDACVDDFTTKSLIPKETGCVSRCVQKFMAGSSRIGERFAEQQAQMMQNPPQGAGR
jgi:import inner membrane translocase subunit TIM9